MPTPSSNWLALQKKLPSKGKKRARKEDEPSALAKRRKIANKDEEAAVTVGDDVDSAEHALEAVAEARALPRTKNGESLPALRTMIHGHATFSPSQSEPGKYLALDCEMVGVGPEGAENALARVSLVNFYGAVVIDAFVRPRERVVDYRTQWSGIRPADMVHAKPFEEVQKQVADLLDGKILVGHAVHNDLKALLLTHPRPHTRDTQYYAWKHKVVKSNRIALRVLALQELGVKIQGGEHSSVTDARATMAIYRIHRKEWEKGHRPLPEPSSSSSSSSKPKASRKAVAASTGAGEHEPSLDWATEDEKDDDVETVTKVKITKSKKVKKANKKEFPGGGRKGVSSGLSVVVAHRGGGASKSGGERPGTKARTKSGWWKELG